MAHYGFDEPVVLDDFHYNGSLLIFILPDIVYNTTLYYSSRTL